MLRKGDFIVGLIIISIALGCWGYSRIYFNNRTKSVNIRKSGKTIKQVNFRDNQNLVIKGRYTNIVEVKDGRIRIKESDCPNQLCVRMGWISKEGSIITCAPNGVIISIQGERVVDDVVR